MGILRSQVVAVHPTAAEESRSSRHAVNCWADGADPVIVILVVESATVVLVASRTARCLWLELGESDVVLADEIGEILSGH